LIGCHFLSANETDTSRGWSKRAQTHVNRPSNRRQTNQTAIKSNEIDDNNKKNKMIVGGRRADFLWGERRVSIPIDVVRRL
jgi:hypothetical protein